MNVVTVGTFDLLHKGHINIFKMCKQIAGSDGFVSVGVNSDDFVHRYKKRKPIMDVSERLCLVESCKYVDEVWINEWEDLKKWFADRFTNIIVIGSDWARKDYYTQIGVTQDWLDENNISMMYVPYTQGISTTELKRRINEASDSHSNNSHTQPLAR